VGCSGTRGVAGAGFGSAGVIGGVANASPAKKDKPPKDAAKVALACVAEGMRYGLADTWSAEQLADYCIEVAARVAAADYVLP